MIYIAPEDEMTPVIKELHDHFTNKGIAPKVMDGGTEISIGFGSASVIVAHWPTVPHRNISVDICLISGIHINRISFGRFTHVSEVFEFVNRKIPEIVSELNNLHTIFKEEA